MSEHEFEIWRGDDMLAGVCTGDRKTALKEVLHYLAVYANDGEGAPVVEEIVRVKIDPVVELAKIKELELSAAIERADLP